MTRQEFKALSAIESLRLLVQNFNSLSETFNDRYSVTSLLKLHRAWLLSGWDIAPTQWTQRQLREAIVGGLPPQWDDEENPIYVRRRKAEAE